MYPVVSILYAFFSGFRCFHGSGFRRTVSSVVFPRTNFQCLGSCRNYSTTVAATSKFFETMGRFALLLCTLFARRSWRIIPTMARSVSPYTVLYALRSFSAIGRYVELTLLRFNTFCSAPIQTGAAYGCILPPL